MSTKPFILYNRAGSDTAKNLAKLLNMGAVRDSRHKQGIPSIRWGASKYIAGDNCSLNPAGGIANAANGMVSLHKMMVAGLPVPRVFFQDDVPEGVKVLARKKYHVAGQDILVCESREDIQAALSQGRSYFVPFIETTRELRVHVFDGEVLKVFRKRKDDEDAGFIRSSKKGWGYKKVNAEAYYPKALPIAIAAVKSLGLRFGAVDMACLTEDKEEWIVFEVNTAPSLNSLTISLYVEKFREVL